MEIIVSRSEGYNEDCILYILVYFVGSLHVYSFKFLINTWEFAVMVNILFLIISPEIYCIIIANTSILLHVQCIVF